MPAGLRRAYLLVLAPSAALAPLPLVWTEGVEALALAAYEATVLLLWRKARERRPVCLSNPVLNALGLTYLLLLGVEIAVLRHGLLRSVAHLMLFSTVAKLASLKRPGEARLALLVIFLMTLASASSSTHVASLLYLAVMAFLAFRTLGRLAVLADFDAAPPDGVLGAVPTPGLAAFGIVGGVLLAAPLFYVLPRLHGPFALAPIKLEDALSTALSSDRVDLEAFGEAKRSNRVILRLEVEPSAALPRVLRLREAVFTRYRRGEGVWVRPAAAIPDGAAGRRPAGRGPSAGEAAIELKVLGSGFLFLPYDSRSLRVEDSSPLLRLPDGVVQLATSRRTLRYAVSIGGAEPRGEGSSAIDPASVPEPIRRYAERLTGHLGDRGAVYAAIHDHLRRNFVYTLDPPRVEGDPLVAFLSRTKAGHCEYFASAAAMMLAARGIPARLVTGSYGGEVGFFSRAIVVRGGNLHAWVEADLDGTGFTVLDPTPPAGVPPGTTHVSWWKRLSTVAREVEFFYDRRILGFDSLDQIRIAETVRESVGDAARGVANLSSAARRAVSPASIALGLVAFALLFVARLWRLRPRRPAATRAYLSLRRLLARRAGALAPSVPPAEVARRLAEAVPEAREDAAAVVRLYCASAFGGRELDPAAERALAERVRRLRRLAS
jgi:transglutaminase-like putative cysteine protease